MTKHPINGLDDVVHQRVRLGILTIAHEARRVEFGFLRTALELTAGNLGQHLSVLEKAELMHIEKGRHRPLGVRLAAPPIYGYVPAGRLMFSRVHMSPYSAHAQLGNAPDLSCASVSVLTQGVAVRSWVA